jgi:hypothetical protein
MGAFDFFAEVRACFAQRRTCIDEKVSVYAFDHAIGCRTTDLTAEGDQTARVLEFIDVTALIQPFERNHTCVRTGHALLHAGPQLR